VVVAQVFALFAIVGQVAGSAQQTPDTPAALHKLLLAPTS